MVKKIYLLLIIVCLTRPGFSFSLKELLGGELAQDLITAGEMTISDHADTNLKMVPHHSALVKLLSENIETLKPNIMIESLLLYAKPSSANKNIWSAEEQLFIYNEIVKLSTLKGIQYFSRSLNKMRTLYEFSSIIDDVSSQNPLPDPSFRTVPARSSFFVRQKDSLFGDNIYSYIYDTSASVFMVSQKNLSPLKRAMVTAVEKNNLRSFVALFDAGQYILVYTAVTGRAVLLPGMKDQIVSSINNRTAAMRKWFIQRIGAAYKRKS